VASLWQRSVAALHLSHLVSSWNWRIARRRSLQSCGRPLDDEVEKRNSSMRTTAVPPSSGSAAHLSSPLCYRNVTTKLPDIWDNWDFNAGIPNVFSSRFRVPVSAPHPQTDDAGACAYSTNLIRAILQSIGRTRGSPQDRGILRHI